VTPVGIIAAWRQQQLNIFLIERVATAGDGAVTDSFVNNAG
jgi:hypothetical protein